MTLSNLRADTPWQTLAVLSLAGGALLALLLVIARTPLLASLIDEGAFQRALVLHVTLISVVWLAAMSACLWGADALSGRIAGAGVSLLLAAGLVGLGTPVLADYLPYLDHALTVAGAGLFAIALLTAAVTAPAVVESPCQVALLYMRLPLLMALIEITARLGAGDAPAAALRGGGHQLQIAWTVLLLGLWSRSAPRPGTGTLLIGATTLLCLVAPALHLLGLADLDSMHTTVMRQGLGASVCVALVVLQPWRGRTAIRWSAVLMSTGLVIAAFIDGQNTTIPAHYHGTVGALSVSLIALAIPRAGKAVHAHAGGLLLMMAGLWIAGLDGLARKHSLAMPLPDGVTLLGSSLIGLGGLIAALAVLSAVGSTHPVQRMLAPRMGAT